MYLTIKESCRKRYETFCAELARCRHDPSLDAVHDLRVSIRRLNAVLEKIGHHDPAIAVNRCAQELRLLMKPLGKLRDVHVQAEWIQKKFPVIGAGLNEYLKKLWSKEKRLQKRIISLTSGFTPAACAALHGEVAGFPASADDADFADASCELISGLYGDLAGMKDGAAVRSNAGHLHGMRIALKKYRYTTEILRPVLGDGAAGILRRMHSLQTLLGDIHDFDVLIEKLARFSRKKVRTRYEISNLRNALRKLRRIRREMNARLLAMLEGELTAIAPGRLKEGGDDGQKGQAQD